MNNVLPKFQRPLKDSHDPKTSVSYWDKALDAFDEKKYKEALIHTLNYMNSTLLEGVDTSGNFTIERGQGSALVNLEVTEKEFKVKAPFLKITDNTNKIALLRKVGEVNFSPLTLAQIHLKDDTLWFGYDMPLSLCQPYKVYDVLRDVCVYADDYDDEFVEKYKADFYQEPKVTPLTPENQERAWQQIEDVLKDYQNYSAFFKEKRWDNFQWDIIVISILKIVNMPYVHGTLRTKLQEYVSNMFNGDIDFQFRIDKGTNFMKKLCAMTKEEYFKNIYNADALVSLKWRSSTEIIQDNMKNRENIVNNYVKDRDNFSLCYYLQFSFLHVIYSYNLEEGQLNAIYDVLENVSGLDPVAAAPKLLATYNGLLNGTAIPTRKSAKKGIFSKLFS
ncbi:hypothetical protein UMM65_14350 [Aureibaculum sp. 2210JD6-5]|uniref:hypothetical protein n=1 Tax=Aureibaculum sp. 2210JD6-5 TaxID=3103957 RepID=UPI002AADA19C|nr:hypothetical protein [Aureibaculum sp. 2210JD6-5]MDY7396428.1 hypothetical protein [Aureibaculum sp. 2210JD6-5]